ncbi:sensor domain-containing diguanylate cyclase [Neptunomonas qingdaonensis]|uniref:PAS domain S-box-containing protein/diguanylate cyclase (GGDEF) domain-containing protein n=1 Tax=Neptunomonas qingdaonensis TaxID=1045558 RepID=A0A1I2P8M7_9GAMM|nr:sensor domain-containing diguanylate cyclase [Neptunomonas qingdaonensis]SFG12495.1 PAS domain S-box-containing protein/diguanylate cyclase (GGDEF) domain-containing protein [Neptunomonas qingdaonensis]
MDEKKKEQRAIAFDYLFDSVVITDLQGIITDWNNGSEDLYGYSQAEAIGQPVCMLHVPQDSAHITAEVIAAVEEFGKWTGEVKMLRKDGSIGWIESMCVPLLDDNDQIIGALGINRDITERIRKSEQLLQLAHYDQLTQIPNRYLLLERISHLINQCERNQGTFTLLYIDLDKFKTINDAKGHAFGDKVLQEAARRMTQSIRKSDTLARYGGDEFVLLLENHLTREEVTTLSKILINTLSRTFKVDNNPVDISCCIGIATYPDNGTTTETLLSFADNALYKAKSKGNGTYQ